MGFVIQMGSRRGGGRLSYRAYSSRPDNAAGGHLGTRPALVIREASGRCPGSR